MNEYGNFGKEEIENARKKLSEIKDDKLVKKTNAHLNDPLNFWAIVEHLRREHQEFRDVAGTPLCSPEYEQQLTELADVSNCCDILAMLLLKAKESKSVIEGMESLFHDSSVNMERNGKEATKQ